MNRGFLLDVTKVEFHLVLVTREPSISLLESRKVVEPNERLCSYLNLGTVLTSRLAPAVSHASLGY